MCIYKFKIALNNHCILFIKYHTYHGPIDCPVERVVQQLRPGVHLHHMHSQVRVEQQIEPQELVAVVP